MSEDDFGTINVKRGDRAREIEVLRQHYRQHRDALQRMTVDAPTEYLAGEYQRLIGELDRALAKVEELEGKPAAMPPAAPPVVPPVAEPQRPEAHDAGVRPPAAATPPPATHRELAEPPAVPPSIRTADTAEPRSRVPLILAAALVALALIGWLVWRGSGDDERDPSIVEERTAAVTTDSDAAGTPTVDDTVAPAAAAAVSTGLAVVPVAHDYGTIRKGTRATRQYELSNTTDEPMSIQVARSACRCLFYEHAPVIPPKAKENITVTIDGARAKAGTLHEEIRITSKADAAIGTTIDVNATIR
ncbi:MAG TPA: DUF1573 domain-containing protein [Thermoanaerobaculia bacterium]